MTIKFLFFLFIALFFFVIYLIIDFFKTANAGGFFDKWVGRMIWLWVPFYAFKRLIKEVILKKK